MAIAEIRGANYSYNPGAPTRPEIKDGRQITHPGAGIIGEKKIDPPLTNLKDLMDYSANGTGRTIGEIFMPATAIDVRV